MSDFQRDAIALMMDTPRVRAPRKPRGLWGWLKSFVGYKSKADKAREVAHREFVKADDQMMDNLESVMLSEMIWQQKMMRLHAEGAAVFVKDENCPLERRLEDLRAKRAARMRERDEKEAAK
jgi:hypothetical protein